jgi:glycosyltransferase involved in cell wall biosynthesis
MPSPLISCIVPAYNGERYLREALDSIVAQTYRPFEIIVADDGSRDGTASLVASYGHGIRYLFQPNAGTAAACNLGLSAAQGEFIAFLAHDDLWHPEKLERQIRCLRARPQLAGCVAHVTNFWSPELRREEIPPHDQRVFAPVPGYVPQTLLATKALFDAVGGFNTTLKHADATDWFLRVREHGALIELLPDVLVRRRLHQTNLSRRMASASRAEFLQLLKATLDRRRAVHNGDKGLA